MSDKNQKLSESEIRELFHKYEINKNNSVDQNELSKLVGDVYLKNHNITDVKDLTPNDEQIIKRSVEELLKTRDHNKDKSLPLDELLNYHQNQNILQLDETVLDKHRELVYGSRVARAVQAFNSVIIGSRPLAYASEVGESARPIVSRSIVVSLYGLSIGYVILDTFYKSLAVRDHGIGRTALYAMDLAIWHSLASMALPAFTIHSIVKFSGILMKNMKTANPASKLLMYGPTCLGLGSIPFIIHPIDHFTDVAMNNTLRRIYSHKLPKTPMTHH